MIDPLSRQARAVLAGLACAALALGACRRETPADAPAPRTIAAPARTIDATLTLAHNPDSLRYEGTVGDAATRAALLRQLDLAYGARARGEIRVDPRVRPAPWARGLGDFLAGFAHAGAMARFAGARIELSGAVDRDARTALRHHARRAFPGATLTGLFEPASTAGGPGVDRGALFARLNRLEIVFEPDSAAIAPHSLDAVSRAAHALRAHDGAVRIGVHPAASDHPDYDRELARQRAQAVKIPLVIQGIPPGRIDTAVPSPAPGRRGRPGKVEFAALP